MLDLLKAAAQFGGKTDSRAMPDDILAFELDYPSQPDLATERTRIETLLGGDGFDLFAYSQEDDPNLLILQFQRVTREQSAELLLKEAADLNDALGTLAVTPAIDAPYSDILSAPADTEGLGRLVWGLCQSKAPGSTDAEWARKMMQVPQAEAAHNVTGQGVLIGQPDTGVAAHDELATGLDTSKGYDFLADQPGPFDPLSKSMASPGHGTGTSSVAISRPDGQVTGTARGATLVPLRVMNRVVIGLSGRAVAAGIDHARRQGCQVITMSLGGLGSRSMRRAIDRAVDAGIIVLAAAGNCVGNVTFPASMGDVIAVAGVDHLMGKWRGSCSGSAVDISAPGENVYVARRVPVDPGHTPTPAELSDVNPCGQGTSFAVALTAGVAALWIEKFGASAIQQAAAQRGLSVNALFRLAVQSTAQVPAGWDASRMGAGIVDAENLLATDLAALPGAAIPTESTSPALLVFGEDFDGTPVEAEANYLATDWRMRTDPSFSGRIETALPPRPTPQLAEKLKVQPPEELAAPAAIVAPATPPVPLHEAVRRLALRGDRAQMAESSVSAKDAVEILRSEGPSVIMSQVEGMLTARRNAAPNLVDGDLQQEAMRRMDVVVSDIASGADTPASEVEQDEQRATLEALVRLTGRPAVRVKADGSEIRDPRLENWASVLVGTRHKWQPLTNAVGRIDVMGLDGNWTHAGTGFVLADGKVMTNRHVIDSFVDSLPSAPGTQRFLARRRASIIFDPEAEDETTRFDLTHIITAGKSAIGQFVSLSKLDMAVVAMDPNNGHRPPPPAMGKKLVSLVNPGLTDILLSGFPARPHGSSGPSSQSDDFLAFWDRLAELYGEEYGKQYLSPGKIMARPGAVAGDPQAWVFTHDATTMPGNSGSALISLHGTMKFCGLHFGGATLSQNYAHDIKAVRDGGDGVFDTGVLG